MGLLGDFMLGRAILARQTTPHPQLSASIALHQNLLLLGGPGRYGTALRENAMLRYIQSTARAGCPVVCLAGDATLASLAADLPDSVLLGEDVAYDPFVGCRTASEAARMLEQLLPRLLQRGDSGFPLQSLHLLRFFLDTMVDSFGIDALTFANLETIAANLKAHQNIMSFLLWMRQQGYRTTQALNDALHSSWTTGMPGLILLVSVLTRALAPIRRTGLPTASLTGLLAAQQNAVVYIPPADRGLLANLLGAELIQFGQAGGVFALADYEVQLPEALCPLFFYNGQGSLPFAIAMRSLQTLQTMQQTSNVTLQSMLPVTDEVVVLGMQSMPEAQTVLEAFRSSRLRLMPSIGGGRTGGLGFHPMQAPDCTADALIAGHLGLTQNRGIVDGGGAIITVTNNHMAFYHRLTV